MNSAVARTPPPSISTRRSLAKCLFVLFSAALADPAAGQNVTLAGSVRSEAGDPLANALIVLDPEREPRQATTGRDGTFRFTRVPSGAHEVRVLRIGYRAWTRQIVLAGNDTALTITLELNRTVLDTLRIVAERTGVIGLVVDRAAQRAVPSVGVRVIDERWSTNSDNAGRFELKGVPPGAYVLVAQKRAFQPRILSVLVPENGAIEVVIPLDSATAPRAKRLAMPTAEFLSRAPWMGTNSVLVPRSEFSGEPSQGIGDALRTSLSFLMKGLFLDDGIACVYVDGIAQPGRIANDYNVAEVEAVEVYGLRSDYTGTLAKRWPTRAECGRAELRQRSVSGGTSSAVGLQKEPRFVRAAADNVVRAVVIWLKH